MIDQGDIITDQLRNVIGSLTELDSSYLALAKGMIFWHKKISFVEYVDQIQKRKRLVLF